MPPAKPLDIQLGSHLDSQAICPCGSKKSLGDCCLPYVEGKSPAPTAEALMRSRYTAHVLLAIDYLWNTWSPEERIRSSKADIAAWASSCEWLGLQILETKAGGVKDDQGLVSFIALFRQNGELHQHHEVSVFKKTLQGWLYVNHKQ
jgi:SEC-C motif-containing protein